MEILVRTPKRHQSTTYLVGLQGLDLFCERPDARGLPLDLNISLSQHSIMCAVCLQSSKRFTLFHHQAVECLDASTTDGQHALQSSSVQPCQACCTTKCASLGDLKRKPGERCGGSVQDHLNHGLRKHQESTTETSSLDASGRQMFYCTLLMQTYDHKLHISDTSLHHLDAKSKPLILGMDDPQAWKQMMRPESPGVCFSV